MEWKWQQNDREIVDLFFAFYRNACSIFLDGAPPCGPAGARNFMNNTRTILQRNSKFIIIDIHTGATSMFVNGVSFIQQLNERMKWIMMVERRHAFAFVYMPATHTHTHRHRSNCGSSFNPLSKAIEWMTMQATLVIHPRNEIPLTKGHKKIASSDDTVSTSSSSATAAASEEQK